MWLLNFLPDVAVHLITLIGFIGLIFGFVLDFMPLLNRYKLPVQLVSLIIFSLGLWFEGGIAKNKEWADRVMQLEAELANAKNQAERVNTEIVTKILNKKQESKEKVRTVIEYIDRTVSKSDKTCPIPQSVITSHNAAATNNIEGLNDNSVVPTQEHNDLAKHKTKMVPKK